MLCLQSSKQSFLRSKDLNSWGRVLGKIDQWTWVKERLQYVFCSDFTRVKKKLELEEPNLGVHTCMRDKPSSNQFSNKDCQVRGNGIHSVLQVLVQLGTVVWRQKVLKGEQSSKNQESWKWFYQILVRCLMLPVIVTICVQRCWMFMISSSLISVPILISDKRFTSDSISWKVKG